MSQRETLSKPFVLASIGGVNERVVATELPPADFTNLDGVFPHYAGMQVRLFGKRLLAKYADPIMGIAQFWTPQGYAQGLYQFDESLSAGPWLTPTSNIVIPALPPSPGFDGGGMSLDDFGNPYGGPVSPPNVCLIGFVGENSAHEQCGTPPANVDTPDDSNGGPAGQGKRCRWTQGTPVDVAIPVPVSTMFGVWNAVPIITAVGPAPYPVEPTIPAERPSIYSSGFSGFGNIWFARAESRAQKVNLGFGNWVETQTAAAENTTGLLNLSALIDVNNPPSLIEIQVRHNGNPPFDRFWVTLVGNTDPTFAAIPIDVWTYVQPNYRHDDGGVGGYINSDFIVLERVRLSYNGVVCS